MTYSNEFKLVAVKLSMNLRGRYPLSVGEIADMMDIGRSTLYSWRREYMFDHTCFGDKKYRLKNADIYRRKINDIIITWICDTVVESGTVSIKRIKRHLKNKFNVTINRSYIYYILKKNKITYKKCEKYKCPHSNEIMENRRKELLEEVNKIGINNVESLDETSIEIGDKPNYGWARKGKTIRRKVPHNRKRYSLIMTINTKKITGFKLVNGSFNGKKFNDFIKQDKYIGKSLFMDNARIHHNREFKKYAQENHCSLIYNIPYCPKYNPIEYIFSVIKSEIKKRDITSYNELNNELKKIIRKLNRKQFITYYNHAYSELTKNYS